MNQKYFQLIIHDIDPNEDSTVYYLCVAAKSQRQKNPHSTMRC